MAYGVNAPFGLQPRQYLNGSPWIGQTTEYNIISGYATAIFTGDPVIFVNTGGIGIGVAGSAIVGVFQGCKYFDANNKAVFSPFWPAAQTTYLNQPAIALIADDPAILYDVQTNGVNMAVGGSPGIIQADLGYNFNFISGAGSTLSGQSGFMADNATEATTATLNLKLIRLTPRPNNVYYKVGPPEEGRYNNGLFLINNHIYKGGTGTLGI